MDPFDVSQSDPNSSGFLGMSPSFWQHLAMFGGSLGQAANARTASGHLANGTDFSGPLGAAINNTFQQSQNLAKTQSELGYQRANTQKVGLENMLTASGLPLAMARNQMLAQVYQNPDLMKSLLGGGGTPDLMGGGNVPLAGAVHQMESGSSMQPGITGDGGKAAGPMQVHQAALDDVNKANGTSYTLDQLTANPTLGKWAGDQYLKLQQARFPGRPDLAMAAYNAGPTATQNAVNSGAGVSGLPQSTQQYVQRGTSLLGSPNTQQALGIAQQYEAQANRIELAKTLGLPMAGDPAALRAAANQFRTLALAGPTEAEKGAAGMPYNIQRVNAGGVLFNGAGQVVGSAPIQSKEVITEGLNKGMEVTVLRDPMTNQIVGGGGHSASSGTSGTGQNGLAPNGIPAGAIPTELPPAEKEYMTGAAKIQEDAIKHDNKIVEEDLAHTIENVLPAKQQLFQLRDLVDRADTGAAGDFRAQFKNWVQTFAPDFVSQVTGDASPAQEFKKIALMGAGKQERGDLGARGGFRAIEMYLHANPSLENQPTANHDMANALLISHQFHEDYATGATDFFNRNYQTTQDQGTTKGYQKISRYDQQFVQKMRPELYASAISAINGAPSKKWANGLTPSQVKIVAGILQRADPSAVIDMDGYQIPVARFQNAMGPTDIMQPSSIRSGEANGR